MLHLHWPDCSFGAIVREWHGEVDCEAQDQVFVAGKSSDESAGLGCQRAAVAVVVGGAFGGQRAQVVVPDLSKDSRIELVGAIGASLVCGLVASSRVSAMAWAHSCPAGSASLIARKPRSKWAAEDLGFRVRV